MEYIMLGIWFVLFFGGGAWGYRIDKRKWNGGVCPETGEPWELFDRSSQGCRGYTSDGFYIWISWPVDTKGATR